MAHSRPALPPTTNTLTPQQRAELLRKSRKVEQLLGSAPYFVNLAAINVQNQGPTHASNELRRRAWFDAILLPSPPLLRESSLAKRSPTVIRRKRYRRSVANSGSTVSSKRWLGLKDNDIPMLRVELDRLHLKPIPTESSSTCLANPESIQRRQELDLSNAYPDEEDYPKQAPEASDLLLVGLEEFEDRGSQEVKGSNTIPCYSEIEHEPRVQAMAAASSSFARLSTAAIPSPMNVRKAKMDRLRKKLGARVPLELVFPDESNLPHDCRTLPDESPSYSSPPFFPSLSLKIRPETGSPVSPAPLTEASHDLMVPISPMPTTFSLPPPPPRPKKSPKRAVNDKHGHRRRAIRPAEVPPPLPPLNPNPLREKLSLILEIPEETALEAKALEISLNRIDESPSCSRPSTSGSVTSSMSGALAASTAPTTPTSSTMSCANFSPSRSTTPGSSLKKRPSSYRKAPPPITDELIAALNQTIVPSYHP